MEEISFRGVLNREGIKREQSNGPEGEFRKEKKVVSIPVEKGENHQKKGGKSVSDDVRYEPEEGRPF